MNTETTAPGIRFDLLREIHAFVNTLPPKQLYMNAVFHNADSVNMEIIEGGKDIHTCGAIACVMGWAALLPRFRAMGLGFENHGLRMHGGYAHYYDAAKRIFNLKHSDEGAKIFGAIHDSPFDEEILDAARGKDGEWLTVRPSDTEVFNERLKRFFAENGEVL